MRYTREDIEKRLERLDSRGVKLWNRLKGLFKTALLTVLVASAVLLMSAGYGMFRGILDSAPDINAIHVGPTEYATKTYDREGNLVATLVTEGSNRERAEYDEIPKDLINAFVAIEDERFWSHNGIDLKSIGRAIHGVLSDNESAGGGSTLTQQLIKNNVFSGGMNESGFERYERKLQEQYLALELEHQPKLDKKSVKHSIITEYLNTINLGANSLGVKVAARRYFNKEVSALNLAESTVLASITKNPSNLNPITHPENNQKRRAQVLKNMLKQGYIDEQQYQEALSEQVYEEIKNANVITTQEAAKPYSYFTDELTEQVIEALVERLDYTEEEARKLLYSGGLSIYTTQDPRLQAIVDEEVNSPKNYDTVKYSVEWRLTIRKGDNSIINYSEKDLLKFMKEVKHMDFEGLFKTEDAAKTYIEQFKKQILEENDSILAESYDTTLEPQLSVVLEDPHSGEILAISGGRGEKRGSLTLNRATNVLRQPGSTFKVISSFAPAIDKYGATLASTYYDAPYTLGNKTFKNWYSGGYLGYQSIRDGIIYSLNIVAVRCLMETVQPKNGRKYAEILGITSLTETDENPALALGGLTRGVSNLELTQAYSVIANGGQLRKAKFFTKIVDQNGQVLMDMTEDEPVQVMQATTAYLLTDAMKDSMLPHRAFADNISVTSTSTRAHFDGMSLAGKSGTTTSNRDIWFEGFSPYYICGVWGGCDENQSLRDPKTGSYNGGTGYHKDIWRKIMKRIHEGLPDTGFQKPDGIVTAEVCRKSGKLPTAGCHNDYRGDACIKELFAEGTVPTEKCELHTSWGAIRVPKEFENFDTSDRYFSERSTEEEDEEDRDIVDDDGPVSGKKAKSSEEESSSRKKNRE